MIGKWFFFLFLRLSSMPRLSLHFVSVNLSLLNGISFKHMRIILGISGNVIMCCLLFSPFFNPTAVVRYFSINIIFMTQYTPHVLRHGRKKTGDNGGRKLPYAIDARSIGKFIFKRFFRKHCWPNRDWREGKWVESNKGKYIDALCKQSIKACFLTTGKCVVITHEMFVNLN